jgi:hypothetical protein
VTFIEAPNKALTVNAKDFVAEAQRSEQIAGMMAIQDRVAIGPEIKHIISPTKLKLSMTLGI